MNDHASFEVLNDLLDDRLEPAQHATVMRHVEQCAECSRTWSALRSGLADAMALPAELPAPDRLWDDIRVSLRPRRVAVPRPPAWVLAAAAMFLIALSSGVTAWWMNRHEAGESVAAQARTGTTPVLPAAFVAAERGYAADVADLRALFERARPSLAPETIRVVEQSLATIDDAIAEARRALLADPGNMELAELIGATYRQKIELLRRAAELPHSL